jgi:hypothetical protein
VAVRPRTYCLKYGAAKTTANLVVNLNGRAIAIPFDVFVGGLPERLDINDLERGFERETQVTFQHLAVHSCGRFGC